MVNPRISTGVFFLVSTELVREPLSSAGVRLGGFFRAALRRRVRLKRPEKFARNGGYFVDSSKECSFVSLRWLVEPADLSHKL